MIINMQEELQKSSRNNFQYDRPSIVRSIGKQNRAKRVDTDSSGSGLGAEEQGSDSQSKIDFRRGTKMK